MSGASYVRHSRGIAGEFESLSIWWQVNSQLLVIVRGNLASGDPICDDDRWLLDFLC